MTSLLVNNNNNDGFFFLQLYFFGQKLSRVKSFFKDKLYLVGTLKMLTVMNTALL